MRTPLRLSLLVLALLAGGCGAAPQPLQYEDGLPLVVPNDNRTAGGRTSRDGLHVRLVAQWAAWRPDLDVDSAVTIMAFAEGNGPPRIPGPLLRTVSGTEVRVTVRNALSDSVLTIHGLRAGTVADDTLRLEPGAEREIRFTAGAPGTYLYWAGAPDDTTTAERMGRASQLTGAIVIDPPGARADPRERIFVMTVIDIFPDSAQGTTEDIWELAINGLAWPHTERLAYDVGDTVRWRWLNGSHLPHPMHLHGFHFRVLAKGDGHRDAVFPADEVRHVVTEFMRPGSTFAMEWVPTRAGNWLMHCHMAPHITPYPERPQDSRDHDEHDVAQHAVRGMAGLVLGITTHARGRAAAVTVPTVTPAPTQHVRMLVQQRDDSYGYVLHQDAQPATDSLAVPGPPLILTRGETTAITVVNHTHELTTVHWHGMELESFYDGVAGWSGADSNLAPLIARGDSFTVAFTPPRAGTYIYHTHMDESGQLRSGAYGPMIVLEPGERFDPATELVIMAGGAFNDGKWRQSINGRHDPGERVLHAGTRYRLRVINILPAAPLELMLLAADSMPVVWTPVSKDGAALPQRGRRPGPARVERIGVGETYDFEWTPERAGTYELSLAIPRELTMRQRIRVR